jgi:GNAT superfamily N-acetyltransferase
MPSVETLIAPKISEEDFRQLASLFCTVFPDPARDPAAFAQSMQRTWSGYSGPAELRGRRFVARDHGRIVANANLFPRQVVTSRGPEMIAAICAVMTHPQVRGMGFGKAVVRAAFDRVRAGEFSFALFQTATDARGFYEKLGCRTVANPVVNSRDEENPRANPFWERWVMCYLPVGELPEGEIDLLGRGF